MLKKNSMTIGQIVIFAVFLATLILSYILSIAAGQYIEVQAQQKFEREATLMSERITNKMNRYSDVMYMARSYVLTNPNLSNNEWKAFFRNQSIFNAYEGMSTIYLLDYNNGGGDTDKATAKITHLVSSDISNVSGLIGRNVYDGDDRVGAIDRSILTKKPSATGFLTLATGADGFLVYLPIFTSDSEYPDKLVGTSFRTEQLAPYLLTGEPLSSVRMSFTGEDNKSQVFYTPEDWPLQDAMYRTDTIDVAGQEWQIEFAAPYSFYRGTYTGSFPRALLIIGIVLSLINFGIMESYRIKVSVQKRDLK